MAISAGDVMVEIGADTSGLDRALDQTGNKINSSTGKWKKRMKVAGAAMVGAVAGIGIASLKMAADFDKAMREVNTMMGLSTEEFKEFKGEVRELAKELGVNAVESAEALYQAISAGVPKENVVDFLTIATKAAIAGVTDTTTAVDGLTTVINAFKLPMSDTERVADIMFTTVKNGKTTMDELSNSMFNVAPIAATSGVDFETVAAALATMTKQGIPTAQATTMLRQAIVALQKPTGDMEQAIRDLGYESGEAMIKEVGFAEAINLLRDYTEGSNTMLLKMFGSIEAGSAVMALTGDNAEMFAGDIDAITNSAGAMEAAFEEMEESTSRKMEKLKSTFSDIAISIGEALTPGLVGLMEAITPVIEKMADWAEDNPGLVTTIMGIVGSLGLMLLISGPFLRVLRGLKWVFGGLKWAIAGVGGALVALGAPVALVVALFAAVVSAIGLLIWKWDEVKVLMINGWYNIKLAFKTAWGWIKENVIDKMVEAFDWVKDKFWSLVDFFKSFPSKIGSAFSTIKDIIFSPFNAALRLIEKAINWLIRQMNKISFTVPSWLPSWMGGGKTFGINIPEISLPQFAQGGMIPEPTLLTSMRTGLPYATAGERGPEMVTPMGGAGTFNLNVYGMVVRQESDVNKVARELYSLYQRKAKMRGL